MTLPDTSFVCKNIDVEAGAKALCGFSDTKPMEPGHPSFSEHWNQARAIIAAALGEVIPAEMEKRDCFPCAEGENARDHERDTRERFVTEWQPVVSDKE
jgi:hypothetical protein